MSDSRARALLWRLVGWDESPSQFEDLLNDVESFLRQPVHPESRCQECGNDNPVWYAPHDLWNAVMGTPDNPRGEGVIVCPNCFTKRIPTPRSRAEAEACKWTPLPDDDIWQTECGGLYQVGPNSVADAVISEALRCPCGKRITADPNALPSPVLRSRAEVEAMVEELDDSAYALGAAEERDDHVTAAVQRKRATTAHAALLAALTGGEG